jgi:hypothetical protein
MACGRDADRRAPPFAGVRSEGACANRHEPGEEERMRSTNTRAVVTVAALGALSVAATHVTRAEDVPSGYGANTPNGSVFTTTITNPTTEIKNPAPGQDDQDAYAFQGFPGMKLTVTVKPSKGSTLLPVIEVVRPGGSLVTDDEGLLLGAKGTSRTASMTLDTAGWWQVRVRGGETSRREGDTANGEQAADRFVVFSSGSYSVTIKYSAPALTPLPKVSKTFKVSAAIDSQGDVDVFPFEGYVGQTVGGSFKFADTLLPQVEIVRPDGTVAVGPEEQTLKGTKITFPTISMDQQGTWRVRVVVLAPPDPDPEDEEPTFPTTGGYTLQVKLSKYKTLPSIEPDLNGQYRFTLPGVGGAVIGFDLRYDGAAPTFNSLLDPSGKPVAGISSSVVASSGGVTVAGFQLSALAPVGNYTLTFDAPDDPPLGVTFTPKLVLPKGAKKKKVTMSADEPVILNNSVNPTAGGQGTLLVIGTNGKLVDPGYDSDDDIEKNLKVYIGHFPLVELELNGSQVRGKVPADIPLGLHDVVVESTAGQVGVKVGSFQVVDRPHADTIDPNIGTSAGGFPITIQGEGFRPGRVGIHIDGQIVPVSIQEVTPTSVTFNAPPRSPTLVTFGVFDTETQLSDNLDINSFEYIATASISRLVPSLTTVLGGETIIVRGSSFSALDHVYLETTTPGVYEEMTKQFVDSTRHQFVAPVRPKGVYRVYVTDQFNQPQPPRTRPLTYFQFSDMTATPGVLPSGTDGWDGSTNTVGDFDQDGYDDLVITRVGGSSLASTTHTRILRNSGTGTFSDVTGGANAVMPAVTGSDDWRANRVWLTDVTLDGYPDLVLVSNDTSALPENRSHLRILQNEPRSGLNTEDRVFRDRTVDLMAPIRTSSPLYGGGGNTVVDNWRGLDMWVGDIDKGQLESPPEILITHKETKQEVDVGCGTYCASPYSSGYTYGFYWGGSRAFVWNKTAKGGAGQYKFDYNFFPRKAGVRVQIFNPPAGVQIPICNAQYGSPCAGKFPPFLGKRIAVGDINADGKPDVAVLSDEAVTKDGATISSLQVGINRFNPADGALITDVNAALQILGGSFVGDTVEIGQPGFPDGNSFGVIATSKATSGGGGSVMRLTKFKPSQVVGEVAAFEDITGAALPPAVGSESWQAARILFKDVDVDGDQDMVIVSNPGPGTDPAFRVLRNEIVDQKVGVFRESLKGLLTPLVTSTEHFEGNWMSIGDVNKDGTFDFVITRSTTTQPAPQTRILLTDK